MSAELAGEAPVEPRDRTSRLNRWVTGAALGVLAGLAALVFWPAHGLDTLERPEESLERVVTRDMDFRAAARTAPRWERRLLALAFSSDAGARADAIAWYEELARVEGSPLAELYRIILLAEDGQTEAAESVTTAWAPTDDAARRLAAWARAAYEAEVPAPEELRAAIEAVRRELPPGWFADRLVIRLASRLGDAALVAERERAIQARGAPLLWRLRAILIAETLLVLVGLVALVAWLVGRGGRAARVAMAPIPPPWTALDGLGLFARGAVGLVGVAVVWPFLPDRAWSTLLVSVLQTIPLGGYLLWYCGGSWRTLADTFGLRVPRSAWPTLLRATLGLVGVSTLADVLIDLAGARLGVETHWTDGFQERLVWGTLRGGGRRRDRQLRLRPDPGGAALPRRALRDPSAAPRPRAGDARQRSALRARARLRRGGLRLGLRERGAVGARLRADAEPPARHAGPCREQHPGDDHRPRDPPVLTGRRPGLLRG